MIAVVAIAVVAGIAIPMHFGRSEVTLENAAILLARDLRATQNNAAYMGRTMTISFDEDGGGYRVVDEHGKVVEHPRTGRDFVRRYQRDGVFEGVFVRLVDLGGDRALVYDERGFALESGKVELVFERDSRELFVDEHSGGVHIPGSTTGWKDPGI